MQAQDLPNGAWESNAGNKKVMIVAGNVFSVVVSDAATNDFISTYGGVVKPEKGKWLVSFEFNTAAPAVVGTTQTWNIQAIDNGLQISTGDGAERFIRLDDGKPGALAGAWLITGRETSEGFRAMTPGARRTMKILSGTRFQWIAYNVDTKEFFGTGAGRYTTANGKYTENIDVFSRDKSRIGATLEFDYELDSGKWRHRGKSSKGEPLNEVWTTREQLGI